MTIEDAIKHAEEVANKTLIDAYRVKLLLGKSDECERTVESCIRCANDHLQLARWLRKLKAIEDLIRDDSDYMEYRVGYLRKVMEESND